MDPVTGEPHIYNHHVSEDEVEDVLMNTPEERPGGKGTSIAIGRTASGRYLKVVYRRESSREGALVITAFELSGKPLAAYRRRQRKKQR